MFSAGKSGGEKASPPLNTTATNVSTTSPSSLHPHYRRPHQTMLPPQLPSPASVLSPTSMGSISTTPTSLSALSKPKSSDPPFKYLMAGNFYRSSAPGAPPFVKVGDKVQKDK